MNVKETLTELEQYLVDEDDKVIFKHWKDSYFENSILAEIKKIKEIQKLGDIFKQTREGAERAILSDYSMDEKQRIFLHGYITIAEMFENLFSNIDSSNEIIEKNLKELKDKITK